MTQRWCVACRAAPAAIYCPSDAAILCTACDVMVHEANKLSRRHTRMPLKIMENMNLSGETQSMPLLFDGTHSPEKSSSAATVFDESDESSVGLVVPDTDDLHTDQTSPMHQLTDVSQTGFTKQEPLWGQEHWTPPVPDTDDGGLTSIAGAFVKKEALTLFESSRRQGAGVAQGNVLDLSWAKGTVSSAVGNTPTALADAGTVFEEKHFISSPHYALQNNFDRSLLEDVLGSSLTTDEDTGIPSTDILQGLKLDNAAITDTERSIEQKRLDRQAALRRFRHKRANRSFRKKVRYACRKQLADSRPRVKGRFVGRAKTANTGRVHKGGELRIVG